MQHKAEEAPYRMVTHGKMTVGSTPVRVPDDDYQGTNYNPATDSADGVVAFREAHQKTMFIRIKNTDATETIRYGMDDNLTTANGFSLGPGGLLQENVTPSDPLWVVRGGSSDIVIEFAEFTYI